MFTDMWVFIVAITAIVFGTWALVSIARVVGSYLQGHREDPTLTTSELAGVIGKAVEEAVRPLEAKIERLERQQQRLLPSGEVVDESTDAGHGDN